MYIDCIGRVRAAALALLASPTNPLQAPGAQGIFWARWRPRGGDWFARCDPALPPPQARGAVCFVGRSMAALACAGSYHGDDCWAQSFSLTFASFLPSYTASVDELNRIKKYCS